MRVLFAGALVATIAMPAFAQIQQIERTEALMMATGREDPMPVVEAMVASAETVQPGTGPLFAASAEETGTLLRWIERPGSRLVRSTGPWSSPAAGAGRWRSFMKAADVARSTRVAPAT